MHKLITLTGCLLYMAAGAIAAETYCPPKGEWESRPPAELGFEGDKLAEAVAYAQEGESPIGPAVRPLIAFAIAHEPYPDIIGPVKDRGPTSGILLRHGFIAAEWGPTDRVDMTFSVTKSYVSTCAGLAYDRGLIKDIHDPVREYVDAEDLQTKHNSTITWHMFLNQTSEWQGELWGKPDWSDRFKGRKRPYRKPGTHWLYNDVRVNRLALALLELWRRPLPDVLDEYIMEPIGASGTWEWHGYENSWVEMDGKRMQSVSGGAHWGGGMWISARDHARFGLLYLRNGKWGDKQVLSEKWIQMALTPTAQNKTYGYMNWEPNTGRERYFAAPESSFFAHGAGTNVIWCDPEHDLVAVLRWVKPSVVNGFIERVLRAME